MEIDLPPTSVFIPPRPRNPVTSTVRIARIRMYTDIYIFGNNINMPSIYSSIHIHDYWAPTVRRGGAHVVLRVQYIILFIFLAVADLTGGF